ncbi:uncharacterized protein LAESUDRAFT_753073 [Laetiporus sulphureus 93-53]|uniref:Transmembrane protein n=1 Tax=Laetiporus sulphureus 93-53 TaxID=1314785 RepID=A0A165BC97_9APHY|nr:uncharacterized protein LAESUDRAFT_753073 [Laetiporus sulphureus 93-53]KZT00723.1 hypothetical protein LAESUDRAFT_753073 [Laetiporus sulphureus 93-53]
MSTRPPSKRGTNILLRAYNNNLRPVVAVVATVSAIGSLIAAISCFRSINVDKDYGTAKLATFAIIVGSLYAGVCGVQVFGIATAVSQRLWMARIYAMLSVVSAGLVVGAALMRVIVHFILKNDLINECTTISQGDVVVSVFGFWGTTYETKLTQDEANSYCKDIWHHDSFVEILSLIVEIVITAFFSSVAFAYFHQLNDPTSAANVTRVRVTDTEPREGGYPVHYNPPYLEYDAPPAPVYDPSKEDDLPYGGAKPPMYTESGDDLGTYGSSYDKSKLEKDDPFADFEATGALKGTDHAERGDFV